MKRLLILLYILSYGSLRSQHAYFAALDQQLLMTNPAFTGSNQHLRVQSIYGINYVNTNFQTTSFYTGADIRISKRSGFGLSFQNLVYPDLWNRRQFDLNYSLTLGLNKWCVVPALKLSYYGIDIYKARLRFPEPLKKEVFINDSIRNLSTSVGLLFYSKRSYIGLSLMDYFFPLENRLGTVKRHPAIIFQPGTFVTFTSRIRIRLYGFIKFEDTGYNQKGYQVYGNSQLGALAGRSENLYQYGGYVSCYFLSGHIAHRLGSASICGLSIHYKGWKIGYNNLYYYKKDFPAKYSHEFFISYSRKSHKLKDSTKVRPLPWYQLPD